MARKKKVKDQPKATGWDAEDRDEAVEADGMKRLDMDVGRVELVDRDQSTPFIETYDEDTGELEGKILLKNGNREGLLAFVKIIEEVNVDQDHASKVNSIDFTGKLNVENPSKVDRIWDIDITLKNIDETDLKSSEIKIRELGTDEGENIDSRDFKISGEPKNLLLIKEYINSLQNAGDVLNLQDLETNLLKLKENSDYEPATEYDEDSADSSEVSLESYAISIDKDNSVWFAIALHSLFEKPISNVKIVKDIPADFSNVVINDSSVGTANVEGSQVVWTIERLEPGITELIKFSATVHATSIDAIKTGPIEGTYRASS